jgi:hypothetical protein
VSTLQYGLLGGAPGGEFADVAILAEFVEHAFDRYPTLVQTVCPDEGVAGALDRECHQGRTLL